MSPLFSEKYIPRMRLNEPDSSSISQVNQKLLI